MKVIWYVSAQVSVWYIMICTDLDVSEVCRNIHGNITVVIVLQPHRHKNPVSEVRKQQVELD